MIVRPNAEPSVVPYRNDSDMGFENLGHKTAMQSSAMTPTENTAANVHCGGGYHGFGFATGADGENDYQRPDTDVPKIPGA